MCKGLAVGLSVRCLGAPTNLNDVERGVIVLNRAVW